MSTYPTAPPTRFEAVTAAAARAIEAIPPAWPLEATVAVNPFLGQTAQDLACTSTLLARVYGASATMPAAWYAEKVEAGELTEADLASLPTAGSGGLGPLLRTAASGARPPRLDTVADVAMKVGSLDWPGIVADRLTAWASGFFDHGQALWAAPQRADAYAHWRLTATHDLTPEILGLAGFAAHVASAPDTPERALLCAADRLGLPDDALERYFLRCLATTGGWAQLARQRAWRAAQEGLADDTALALLAARVIWDEAILRAGSPALTVAWAGATAAYGVAVRPGPVEAALATLQEAYEASELRRLLRGLAAPKGDARKETPLMQAVFCIDVRSEVFRRALESLDARIETAGFAGFFGLRLEHRRLGSDTPDARLPVLLTPALKTRTAAPQEQDIGARIAARGVRAWGRFKLAAVSSFAFVEASGPLYAIKLAADSLRLKRGGKKPEPAPRWAQDLPLAERAAAAETILRAMSMTDGFAPVVLLVGHGASVRNNPHASGLQCGACGGHPGDVNARVLARLLNEPDVRQALADRGLAIPAGTLFVGALHDTTADEVTLFSDDGLRLGHSAELAQVREWLSAAGRLARAERQAKLPGARKADQIARRGADWAEIQPEWALAGCRGFVAAPRSVTRGANLGGRVFLHDYDWRKDDGFKVLELILTAPVVVASWISLQYYGSTVAPDVFGSGNKLLHNVVGGFGVIEGGTGSLRTGLSRQSLHDGKAPVHDPTRLAVVVAAPQAAISDILARHEAVRALFDNGWLSLVTIDDGGRATARYAPGGSWRALTQVTTPAAVAA